VKLGENMPYIDIKIAWNWGTYAQSAKVVEHAAGMLAAVLAKDPLVKSIIVKKIDGDGPGCPGTRHPDVLDQH
jgi:phenylpyruvate tautomerase PptA (4-oxalocrotonate tautomerase family)